MTLNIIAAVARDCAIGKDDAMPWPRLQCDMQWFAHVTTALHPEKMAYHFVTYPRTLDIAHGTTNQALRHTTGNACIMGWRTHESIGKRLPHRTSIVLRDTTYHGAGDWPCKARTFNEALENAARLNAANIFAIGGARVFQAALHTLACTTMYTTEIDAEYPDADTYFPWTRMQWDDGMRVQG